MRCRYCYDGISPILRLFIPATERNYLIEPSIVGYLQAWQSV